MGVYNPIRSRPSDNLQPGHNTEHAVKSTAMWLRIQVAPQQDDGQSGVATQTDREDVAERIYPDLTTRVAAPPNKLVAGRAILVTERQPGTAATRQPSEFGHSHDAVPEPVALDRASRSVIGRRATGRFAAGY